MSKDSFGILVKWLVSQPFLNLLVVILIGVLVGGMYYFGERVIPGERAAIFEAVERIEAGHQRQLERQEDAQTKQVQRMSDSFDRALDRMILGNRAVNSTSTNLPTESVE